MKAAATIAAPAYAGLDDSSASETHARDALAALGQKTRLAIFRLLMRHEPHGITVGEIALGIQCPQNTVSGNLAILARAQLAIRKRQGRSVIYRANLAGMRRLIEYLVADCCNGDASLCAPTSFELCLDPCSPPWSGLQRS